MVNRKEENVSVVWCVLELKFIPIKDVAQLSLQNYLDFFSKIYNEELKCASREVLFWNVI